MFKFAIAESALSDSDVDLRRVRTLSLRLHFNDDSAHPMHAFIAADERYGPTRLVQWNPTERGTNLMLFRVVGPEGPYTAALEDASSVRYYETTALPGNGFSVLVEDDITDLARHIVEAYASEHVVVVPPVVFRTDLTADLQLVGENDALQRILDQLPDPIDGEIRRLTTTGPRMAPFVDRLTDRQRRVLVAALEAGYYDEPRQATIEDVAEALGLATGTVAEHVRKAHAQLVRHVLGSDR